MEKSLIAATTGIEANQTYLDVIGNNIANADTTGYKSESAVFTDLLAQQISGATAPSPTGIGGGINPMAVGSGVRIGAVTNDQSQGSLEQTNQPTDVAIQGSGFLVAQQGGQVLYTRAGNLTIDANGDLTTPNGALIQGWMANSQGVLSTNGPTAAVKIPTGQIMPAQATTEISLGGNLPAWNGTASTPPVVTTTINAYDSLGTTIPVTLTFTGVKGTANSWTLQGTVPNPTGGTSSLWSTAPTIAFDPSTGQVQSVNGSTTTNSTGGFSLAVGTMPTGYNFPTTDTWNIDFPTVGSTGAVTQYAGQQSLAAVSQDGSATSALQSFSIGQDGTITGSFSDGQTMTIGALALAVFSNPGGLADQGNQMYAATANSGLANVGVAGTGGRGALIGGSLEASNVNLAKELTDLVVAQEAYQANTKVVTTTTNVLQSLISMP